MKKITFKTVMMKAEEMQTTYNELLSQSAEFSELVQWDVDYILRKVLPLKADDRTKANRIINWVESEKGNIEKQLEEVVRQANALLARSTIIEKLKLTPEQLAIINDHNL